MRGWAGARSTRATSIWDEILPAAPSREVYAGSHRHDGIFALAGPSARSGEVARANILDVAPTLLYLLQEAIPTDLEGRLLTEAILPALLDERPPEYANPRSAAGSRSATADASAEVEERLRSLGYLE